MTLYTKTVEYVFTSVSGTLAATTRNNYAAITITLPETTSRTFKSVYAVVLPYSACTAAGQNLTGVTIGTKLGAAAFTDITLAIDPQTTSNWGANLFQGSFIADVTQDFINNFGSGATQTCQLGVQFNGVPTINISAKLVITYEYTSTDTTQVKTVRIPLDGYSGALPTSLTQIGSASEIPNLSTFCPESSKSFKTTWFEIETAEEDRGANFSLTMSLDAEAAVVDGLHSRSLSTSNDGNVYAYYWRRDDMSTTAAHKINLAGKSSTNFYNPTVLLCATYTYDASATTSSLNSLAIPMDRFDTANSNTASDRASFLSKVWIEEPNPALVQSAIFAYMVPTINMLGATNSQNDIPAMMIGKQSARTYTIPYLLGGPHVSGGPCIQQRGDSGGVQGAGISLFRGLNPISASVYHTGNPDAPWSFHGAILYLNYTSDIAVAGIGAHNRTVKWGYLQSTYCAGGTTVLAYKTNPSRIPSFSGQSWFVSAAGAVSSLHNGGGNSPVHLQASYRSDELFGSGSFLLGSTVDTPDVKYQRYPIGISSLVRRWSQDTDSSRIALHSSRSLYLSTTNPSFVQGHNELWVTQHDIFFSVTGTVRGYTGTGSGILVTCHNANTYELLASASTAAGGQYSLSWYDSATQVFTEARQDGTHLGRSDNFFLT